MTMSVLDAIKLVRDGKAAEHIGRFIGIVKYSAVTGETAHFEFEDALVAAMVLSRLSESAEGRKLLGLSKRKNTQYKADDFRLSTPQSRLADQYRRGEITKKQAAEALATSLEPTPDLRTAQRLLEDLADRNEHIEAALELELAALGASSDAPGSRAEATRQIIMNIAGNRGCQELCDVVERSNEPPERKRDLLKKLEEIIVNSNIYEITK